MDSNLTRGTTCGRAEGDVGVALDIEIILVLLPRPTGMHCLGYRHERS